MSRLADHAWLSKYTPVDGDLVERFYIPALRCAVRYDRTTGYFSASALTVTLRGDARVPLHKIGVPKDWR